MSDDAKQNEELKKKLLANRRYFCFTCGNLVDGNEAVWNGMVTYHPACAPKLSPAK